MESVLITIFFGYLLILVEGFLPGGIFGLFGAVCILIASYFAYSNLGGIVPSLITFLLSSAGGLLILFLQFKWLSKSKLGRKRTKVAKSRQSRWPVRTILSGK